jgi:hypothetical protein
MATFWSKSFKIKDGEPLAPAIIAAGFGDYGSVIIHTWIHFSSLGLSLSSSFQLFFLYIL